MPSPALKVVAPGQGDTARLPGFGAQFKLRAADAGGVLSIVEHPFDVGFITRPHRHSREDEFSIVLEGRIGFRSDDSETVLGPGGYIVKPRGQMHAMWNAGDLPGRIIEVIVPGGFADYFRELADLIAADPPAPSAAHDELAATYGLTYGRPEWFDDIVKRYNLTPPVR